MGELNEINIIDSNDNNTNYSNNDNNDITNTFEPLRWDDIQKLIQLEKYELLKRLPKDIEIYKNWIENIKTKYVTAEGKEIYNY